MISNFYFLAFLLVHYLLYLPHLDSAVLIISIVLVLIRVVSQYFLIKIPDSLIYIAVIASTAFVVTQYKTLLGLEAATSLLILLSAIQTLKIENIRASKTMLFIMIYMTLFLMLYEQTLLHTTLLFVDVAFFFYLLALMNNSKMTFSWNSFKRVLFLILIASPIWVTFFTFLPRVQIALLPPISKNASMGFSDELKPGEVTKLIESNQIVLHAVVNPDLEKIYWRGRVLGLSSGLKWVSSPLEKIFNNPLVPHSRVDEKKYIYQRVTIEPLYGDALFSVGSPVSQVRNPSLNQFKISRAGVMQFNQKIASSYTYEIYSQLQLYDEQPLAIYSTRSRNNSPRTLELISKLKENIVTDDDVISVINNFFRKGNFNYTLTPKAVESIDSFLFDTKEGFCEHYATAYAYLLRELGTPSRTVVGFVGGEKNPFSSEIIVREKDAHAWVEFYHKEKKEWVAVDPTELIVRGRVSSEEAIRQKGKRWYNSLTFLSNGYYLIDAWSREWSIFLYNFNFNYQREHLYKKNVVNSVALVFISIFSVMLIVYLSTRYRVRHHPYERLFKKLERKLMRKGLLRKKGEGEFSFGKRLINELDIANSEQFFEKYVELKYRQISYSRSDIKQLKGYFKKITL